MNYSADELKRILVDELPRVRRFAYSLTGNKADADDLVQNLVLKLLQKGLSKEVSVVPWILRVCKNIWLDEIRSRDVRVKAVIENKIPGMERDFTEGEQENRYTLDQVLAVLDEMSDEQRMIISLVIIEGFSYAEAADVLEVPQGAVMSRLSRARKKMLELIESKV
ncbi:RNA polymerase sigma factor [Planctobacterium marinum]|uniref:DNA-directed RNA polymerase sigma-70 factor n=1 Tax=Planctobacterium marinum TaxID=1631968 RepID=A0AA48KQ54_9ALTE|nr:DNA-directed RNA polymerase sigma-70 factor [Planctobacterium marinum]